MNNLKKKKSFGSTSKRKTKTISKNPNNARPQWKKVKLSGNLLSLDDGGASLEGLLGLEVLENYDGAISVTKGKPNKGHRIKKSSFNENVNNDDSNDDHLKRSKNERKKRKQTLKKCMKKKEQVRTATEHYPPGRFVRSIPNCSDTGDDLKTIESELNKEVLTTNDLIVSIQYIT